MPGAVALSAPPLHATDRNFEEECVFIVVCQVSCHRVNMVYYALILRDCFNVTVSLVTLDHDVNSTSTNALRVHVTTTEPVSTKWDTSGAFAWTVCSRPSIIIIIKVVLYSAPST